MKYCHVYFNYTEPSSIDRSFSLGFYFPPWRSFQPAPLKIYSAISVKGKSHSLEIELKFPTINVIYRRIIGVYNRADLEQPQLQPKVKANGPFPRSSEFLEKPSRDAASAVIRYVTLRCATSKGRSV